MSAAQDNSRPQYRIEVPPKVLPLWEPRRHKCLYGGRGGAKSHTFARLAIMQSCMEKLRFLCTREYQSSIADSVHKLLADEIRNLHVDAYFDVQQKTIRNKYTGSEFIFKGLHHNIGEIKSTERINRCWVEEAQAVSEESWKVLEPTIREPGSEIWVSFNPIEETDPTYVRYIKRPPPNALVIKLGWQDNPWFPQEMEELRLWTLRTDPDAYDWVWEGQCRRISEATIFRHRFDVEPFETPEDVDRFYFGADWGFANDPSCLIRCFIRDEVLYIDYEAYAVGVEIDDLPALFAGGVARKTGVEYPGVPGATDWPIFADNARPETISYLNRTDPGFRIDPADKWQGCVEDGIAYLKGFRRIVIHPRCENTAMEFRLYSYKVDPKTNQILPIVVDKWNHAIDAIRYSLNGVIQARGAMGVWARLAS
jgi:phage terminase large subunit